MARHVLFVNTPSYIGGAEVSILALMAHLAADRYSPYLVSTGDGPLLSRARSLGIPTSTLDFPWFTRKRPWKYVLSIVQLAQMIRANRINLVHTNCDHSLRYAMTAARLAGVPYVSQVRDLVRPWFHRGNLEALNRAATVIVSTQYMARACVAAGIHERLVMVVDEPIDQMAFRSVSAYAAAKLRDEHGIPRNAVLIGVVGQVMPLKGHGEFVEGAGRLAPILPDVHFLVVGAPPPGVEHEIFLRDLRARVFESDWSSRFHFIGFRDDIPIVLKAVDILAVPSWEDAFGRVAAEGMASGCAVVASAVGGLAEQISDGVNGILVPPKDVNALAAALRALAVDATLRSRLADAGIRSSKRFAISSHVNQMEALYNSVLSSSRHR